MTDISTIQIIAITVSLAITFVALKDLNRKKSPKPQLEDKHEF